MATRRDQNLPSHPPALERVTALVRERDVTVTDVTQHSEQILTDQDFLISGLTLGDTFVFDGTNWINSTTFTVPMLFGAGSAGAPPVAFALDPDTGMYRFGDNSIGWSTGGVNRAYLNSSALTSAVRFQQVQNGTVMLRMTNTGNTDESWDIRVSDSGEFELRSITDSGTTVFPALQIEHDTGDLTLNGRVFLELGSVSAPSLSFQGATSKGFYATSSGLFASLDGSVGLSMYEANHTSDIGDIALRVGESNMWLTLDSGRFAANGLRLKGVTGDLNANFSLMPSGTATTSQVRFYNGSDSGNVGYGGISVQGGVLNFVAGVFGTGTDVTSYRFNDHPVYFENDVYTNGGSASGPSHSFEADPDTGMYSGGTNILGFSAGGASYFTLDGVVRLTSSIPLRAQGGGTAGDFGHASWSASTYLTSNLYYDGAGDVADEANWRYEAAGGGSSAAGWLLLMSANGAESGQTIRIFTVPTSTGVDNTPSSLTRRFQFSSTQLQVPNGSAGAPGFSFTEDPNTGVYRPSADDLGFSAGGSLILTLDGGSGDATFTGDVIATV